MNPAQLLALPWMALSKTVRNAAWGTTLGIAVTALLICILTHASAHVSDATWLSTASHGMALLDCFLWAGVLSQPLLLAREAYRLRMPSLGRSVIASLVLYALLTIALPALWLAWLAHGNAMATLVQLALGAGLGMAYATLPAYLGIFVIFVPMLHDQLARWLPMPINAAGRFLAWAVPSAVLLWLLIAGFWRLAIRRDYGLHGLHRPILLQLRNNIWYGRRGGNSAGHRLISQRARWLQPSVSLRDCGPGHPLRSLRVALGGWGMPQTTASRVRQAGLLLAGLLFIGLTITLPLSGDDMHKSLLSAANGANTLLFAIVVLLNPLLAIIHIKQLQHRWSRHSAELPLLALLPGMGDSGHVRSKVLAATLLPVLVVQTVLLPVTLLLAGQLHINAAGCALLLLAQLAGMAILVAFGLAVLGHVDHGRWWLVAYGYALMNITCGLVLPLFGDPQALAWRPLVAMVIAVLWATFLTLLIRLALHGWRELQRLPHPFMPSA
ncbi:hypothetical protein [Dyella sp. A6]|uniref:hypothetical protein n=1 Tax=Dyella aluminiiresistens TaxID=3069105 RepID=UPI002E79CD21|nr:hypothetical protein [Dyella sp. A6]